jgi:hypothetical protein
MSADAEPQPAATPELAALTNVVRALQGLSADGQRRVVESALVFLGTQTTPAVEGGDLLVSRRTASPEGRSTEHTNIRSLKEQKNPGSANEMAALVAYYLAEVAQGPEKKPAIEFSDIEKYFKQAEFRLPRHPKMTLVNPYYSRIAVPPSSGQPPNAPPYPVFGLPTRGARAIMIFQAKPATTRVRGARAGGLRGRLPARGQGTRRGGADQ